MRWDGHIPLASCSRTFLCTPTFWKIASECIDLCYEIDFGVWCRLLEDVHDVLRGDTQQSLQVEL